MLYTTAIGILALIFAYYNKNHKEFKGLELAFILISIFLCLRYDFGPDYKGYLVDFIELNSYGISIFEIKKLALLRIQGEVGWVILNKLCEPIGFFGMVILITIFENYIIYRFIKNYISHDWYWYAIFTYCFTASIFLIAACSMLRQWLAVCIFLWASEYLIKRKPVQYFLLTACAISIHTTAWVLVPVYFLTYLKPTESFSQKNILFFIIFFIIWSYIIPHFFQSNLSTIVELEEFSYYKNYIDDRTKSTSSSLFGLASFFIQNYLLTLIVLLQLPNMDKKYQLISILYCLNVLIIPMKEVLPLIGRLQYYFILFGLVAVPHAISKMKEKGIKWWYYAILLYTIFVSREFFSLSSLRNWGSFKTYQTIFSIDQWV